MADQGDALSRLERIAEYSRRAAQVAQAAGQAYLDSLAAERARPGKVRPRPVVAPRVSAPVATVRPIPVGVTPLAAPLFQPVVPVRPLVQPAPLAVVESMVEEEGDAKLHQRMLDSEESNRLRRIVLEAFADEMARQLKGP